MELLENQITLEQSLVVQSKKSNQTEKPSSVFSDIYINKVDRKSHWVGHSKLEELDINDFFERKRMIEDMEDELTGAIIETWNTEYPEVAEEANVDKTIIEESKAINYMEINLKDEQNTEAYKESTNIDIENIDTIEKRNKIYTK